MPRRENRNMPRVESGYLYADAGSLAVDGQEWLPWVESHTAFYFESPGGTFTARRELRSGSWYWYAYRKHKGRLSKLYLGKSVELTGARLVEVAELLDRRVSERG
jgi:LuxR family transcriptional regulator, maltose regulon positive regulatory protein